MKEMLVVILSLMVLIASATSMQTGTCNCGQHQGHEQHWTQQQHPQQQDHQQQYQHYQQKEVHIHVPPQPQQQHHEQPQQHHQQPQQLHKQQCQGHVQQQPYNTCSNNQNLNRCCEFLRQQCNPLEMPFLQSRLLQPNNCQVLQQQCCHELRQIEPRYLHQVIYNMVQSMTHQQQQQEKQQQPCELCGPQQASQSEEAILTVAQYLPSMCGMYYSCGQNSSCDNKDVSGVRN
ncbi:unnamed protein product [Urochloa decumbens]|uniref:Bifunctional inhibitor/plant lipid transfer protein/seed storage helical domain-containing protein n=1 Tax=Urochloa decumbens TaxID=240449 RepID=A0ABC9FF78_9POAL